MVPVRLSPDNSGLATSATSLLIRPGSGESSIGNLRSILRSAWRSWLLCDGRGRAGSTGLDVRVMRWIGTLQAQTIGRVERSLHDKSQTSCRRSELSEPSRVGAPGDRKVRGRLVRVFRCYGSRRLRKGL